MTTLNNSLKHTKRKSDCSPLSKVAEQPAIEGSEALVKQSKLLSDEGSIRGIISEDKKEFANESELCHRECPLDLEACIIPKALGSYLNSPQSTS